MDPMGFTKTDRQTLEPGGDSGAPTRDQWLQDEAGAVVVVCFDGLLLKVTLKWA